MERRRKEPRNPWSDDLPDSRGIGRSEARLILGEDRSQWPKVRRVCDPQVLEAFHQQHQWRGCWVCGERPGEAHHIASGYLRGKSDELTALAMLCRRHHEAVNSQELPLGKLLRLKQEIDKINLDWCRLSLLHGYHLPLDDEQ